MKPILPPPTSNWCKIVPFRWGENTWYLRVYELDWEWHEDYFPIDPSERMIRGAQECALENGMCIKATEEVLNDLCSKER